MYSVPSVGLVFGLRDADAAHIKMVVTPKETYGPGLQHVHIVLPVELHSFHPANVVWMCDHEAPASSVLHALVTTIREKHISLITIYYRRLKDG